MEPNAALDTAVATLGHVLNTHSVLRRATSLGKVSIHTPVLAMHVRECSDNAWIAFCINIDEAILLHP
jgi:hypothetical protein